MSDSWPRLAWVSDRHLRVALGSESTARVGGLVRAAAGRLRAGGVPGLVDVTPAYTTVVAEFEPGGLDAGGVQSVVGEMLRGIESASTPPGRPVEIPMCYEGEYAPDIEEVARLHGMTVDQIAAAHAGAEYTALFVGFMPGFAYLSGLPPELATARLERPRVRVPAGSVGIAGEQMGVYPFASPGGWRLIGRTPLRMFDPSRERPALIEMGDRVRFVRVSATKFVELERREARSASVWRAPAEGRAIRVIAPSLQTTVQDLGRPGFAAIGVPRGGAADTDSLREANRRVGNEEGAACLELSLSGGEFEFECDAMVAVCGAGSGEARMVRAGERVTVRRPVGARAYVAVGGGIDVPRVMGSASTYLGGGFGGFEGRALRAGDRVLIGSVRGGKPRLGPARVDNRGAIRVTPAGQWSEEVWAALLKHEYRVSVQSNRVGLRLDGPTLPVPGDGRMLSEGMMWGAVQVPPDGKPIVLMCDYPTTGGYPVVACVTAEDLSRLGQLRPGEEVRFAGV